MPRPRVVVVAPVVGYDEVPHAGGRYVLALCGLLDAETDALVISPGTRTNRLAAGRSGAPEHVALVGLEPGRSLIGRISNRLALRADGWIRRLDPGAPYLPMVTSLLTSRSARGARSALRAADVIDLQWSESIRLARLLRRLAPRARLVGTFHDVQSQLFAREPSRWPGDALYWRVMAWRSARLERRMVRALDAVLVFSDKDAALLGSPAHASVVPPPLAVDVAPHRAPTRPRVVLVSYLARDENDKGAQWLLREVWPGVRAAVPGARLRLIGGGASEEVLALAEGHSDVELAGFVTDLVPEYAAATACVVPVRQGAGVKFKTVEAMLHGVPTVSTSVGAEGIARPDLLAGQVDDASGLTEALVTVLRDPAAAQPRADEAQRWAGSAYGRDRFAEIIRATW